MNYLYEMVKVIDDAFFKDAKIIRRFMSAGCFVALTILCFFDPAFSVFEPALLVVGSAAVIVLIDRLGRQGFKND